MKTKSVTSCLRISAQATQRWLTGSLTLLAACSVMAQQTVVISPITKNYWAGINFTNTLVTGSNTVTIANGAVAVNFSASSLPANVAAALNPASLTASGLPGTALTVSNLAVGAYSFNLDGSGGAAYSTNVNLFVVPQWVGTNAGSSNSWNNAAMWSGGTVPASASGVYFDHSAVGPFTNFVDASYNIQSLVYLGNADDAAIGSGVFTRIADGATLSVLGTNGFTIGKKVNAGSRPFYSFSGESLLVSNTAADFAVIDASANSTRFLTVNMTNLNNLTVDVRRVALEDKGMSANSAYGSGVVALLLAKTNRITARFADDYSALDFNNSIQYNRQEANNNSAQPGSFSLGLSNAINADSIGIGRGMANGASSSPFAANVGYALRFANSFSNSVTPVASAIFRNTNGARMKLLAVGVDSGLRTANANNRGLVDLRGGQIDLSVEEIWLGRNRTNNNGSDNIGAFYFDWGTVNANVVRAGWLRYTNTSAVSGFLLVGTNGTMIINSNLVLGGVTPSDVTGFEGAAANVSGRLQVNNGGTLRVRQISVGAYTTNSAITLNAGGTIVLTNTIADASKMLPAFTNNGGGLTLNITGTNPVAYVSNLVATAASPINIASISGISSYPVTFSIIKYSAATTPANWVSGSAVAGLLVAVNNNGGNNSIDVTLSTGTPKTLVWKGYLDNQWNNSTKNWLDVATGLQTNFTTLDNVIFNDTALLSSINVSEDVVPSQSPTGMQMTNNVLDFVFTGSGRILGGATFTKVGSKSVTQDGYAEYAAKANGGSWSVTGVGTVGSITVASAASADIAGGGSVQGSVVVGGLAVNSGTISGAVTVQPAGIFTNQASVGGALNLQSGSLAYNAGNFTDIGSSITATNSILINNGSIAGTALVINGTLQDLGGSAVIRMGTTLTINGTFLPGGNGIGTTTVTENPQGGAPVPAGRVLFAKGSTNLFKLDLTTTNYTTLLTRVMTFGPNQAVKSFNGGTIVMQAVAGSFSPGQSFHMFGPYGSPSSPVLDAGLNTTNSYPVMDPPAPGAGMVWDLSDLINGGNIKVAGVVTSPAAFLTNVPSFTTVTTTNSTNNFIVFSLSWPENQIGWRLQQLSTTTAVGLAATNWTDVFTFWTNNIVISNSLSTGNSALFYRMVYP